MAALRADSQEEQHGSGALGIIEKKKGHFYLLLNRVELGYFKILKLL